MTEIERELILLIRNSKDPEKVREFMMKIITDYLKEKGYEQ